MNNFFVHRYLRHVDPRVRKWRTEHFVVDFVKQPSNPLQDIGERGFPIIIPTFENPTYTRLMLKQLETIGTWDIAIIDSASKSPAMIQLLDECRLRGLRVIRLPWNLGPRLMIEHDRLLELLPRNFALTDPDLKLNPAMSLESIKLLAQVCSHFRTGKAGVALDIAIRSNLKAEKLNMAGYEWTIADWELRFWRYQLENPFGLEIYAAEIDTLFAVYDRDFHLPQAPTDGVRVAGQFLAQHLPWLNERIIPEEELDFYRRRSRFSHWI